MNIHRFKEYVSFRSFSFAFAASVCLHSFLGSLLQRTSVVLFVCSTSTLEYSRLRILYFAHARSTPPPAALARSLAASLVFALFLSLTALPFDWFIANHTHVLLNLCCSHPETLPSKRTLRRSSRLSRPVDDARCEPDGGDKSQCQRCPGSELSLRRRGLKPSLRRMCMKDEACRRRVRARR